MTLRIAPRMSLVEVLRAERRLERVELRSYGAGDLLLQPESRSGDVFLINGGRVRVYLLTPDGEDVFVWELGPGECVGELSAVDGRDTVTYFEAKEPTEVFALRRSEFLGLLHESPEFASALLRALCYRMRDVSQRYIEFRCLPMRLRLQAELLRASQTLEDSSMVLSPAPTHTELAKRIGSQRETITKELNRLHRSGLIESSRRAIRILQPSELFHNIEEALGTDPANCAGGLIASDVDHICEIANPGQLRKRGAPECAPE